MYCLSRESVSGLYEVTGLLPREGDVFQYRIKNAKEPHERVVKAARTPEAAEGIYKHPAFAELRYGFRLQDTG